MQPSLYIHIPFCRRKCAYCDFYSAIYDEKLAAEYCRVIAAELGALAIEPPSVYIGGGTPTALDIGPLRRVLAALEPLARRAGEVTVEANPESLTADKISLIRDHGVNRLSVGVQSFRDAKLKALGRIHDAARAQEAVHAAARAGFANISVDLIFGVWDETPEAWREDLERAMSLPVTHISAYGLTYEKGTPLEAMLAAGAVKPLEDEAVAAMYEETIGLLAARGFAQYEVSSYAREGFRCRHNLRYWENDPHVGLGASAVSYIDGVRSRNVPDAASYVARHDQGADRTVSREKLTPIRRARETAAIKIRTVDGIDFAWFKERTGYDLRDLEKEPIDTLLKQGLIVQKAGGESAAEGIALTRRGFLFCDTVSSAFL